MAWHPLGWQAAWLAEVDRAASEVLAHRFPHVANHGDMTLLPGMVDRREIEAPDALVGGTPCQAFSVAGRREGLADERGQLTLAYVDLADAIDRVRVADGEQPCIIVWENVPGVLSSKDNAFGCFLAGLAGEDLPLEPPGKRWGNAGVVLGPQRAVAWRTLDAQWFGLAQRRRRVFVVASAREGFDPAGILFEFEGVRRDTAPSREAGEGVTYPVAPCLTSSGRGVERTGDTRGQDPVVDDSDDGGRLRLSAVGVDLQNIAETGDVVGTIDTGMARGNRGYGVLEPVAFGGGNQSTQLKLPTALTTKDRCDFDSQTFIVHGTQDPCVSETTAFALGRNSGGEGDDVFTAKDYGGDATVDCSPTLRSMGHADSHANGGGQVGIAYAIQERAVADTNCGPGGKGWRDDGCAYTREARNKVQAVAVLPIDMRQASRGATMTNNRPEGSSGGAPGTGIGEFGDPSPTISTSHPPAVCVTGEVTHTLKAEGFDASEDGTGRGQPIVPALYSIMPMNSGKDYKAREVEVAQPLMAGGPVGGNQGGDYVMQPPEMAVRRLMPVECERLQGFPDGWTLVPNSRGKPAADGPRYKQLGNSMAVNVMYWVGTRIAAAIQQRGHNGGPPLDDFDELLHA